MHLISGWYCDIQSVSTRLTTTAPFMNHILWHHCCRIKIKICWLPFSSLSFLVRKPDVKLYRQCTCVFFFSQRGYCHIHECMAVECNMHVGEKRSWLHLLIKGNIRAGAQWDHRRPRCSAHEYIIVIFWILLLNLPHPEYIFLSSWLWVPLDGGDSKPECLWPDMKWVIQYA